jgi:hypothetical protein
VVGGMGGLSGWGPVGGRGKAGGRGRPPDPGVRLNGVLTHAGGLGEWLHSPGLFGFGVLRGFGSARRVQGW